MRHSSKRTAPADTHSSCTPARPSRRCRVRIRGPESQRSRSMGSPAGLLANLRVSFVTWFEPVQVDSITPRQAGLTVRLGGAREASVAGEHLLAAVVHGL